MDDAPADGLPPEASDPPPGGTGADGASAPTGAPEDRTRRAVLLRLDPAVHHALQRWAADDLRSLNAHLELLLRAALEEAGRAPRDARPIPRRGRPRRPGDHATTGPP